MNFRIIISVVAISCLGALLFYFHGSIQNLIFGQSEFKYVEAESEMLLRIDAESEHLLETMRLLREEQSFVKDFLSEDLSEISATLFAKSRSENIDTLAVTNKEGVILVRAAARNRVGDYIFDTTKYGKRLSENKEIVILGYEYEGAKLSLIAGVPITDQSKNLVGSLVATREVNDIFLQEELLTLINRDGAEFVVYDQTKGVVASTFAEKERGLIKDAFSGTVKNIEPLTTELPSISYKNQVYNLNNLSFEKLRYQSNIGGLLLLTPQREEAFLTIGFYELVLFSVSLLLLYFITNWWRLVTLREFFWLAVITLVVALLISTIRIFYYAEEVPTKIDGTTYPIYNSTMHLRPSSGLFDKNFDQRIDAVIVGSGEPINAAQVEISFNPEELRVEDIEILDSFCEPGFVMDRTIDNENGLAVVGCGTRVPFQGNEITLATFVVQPLVEGNVQVSFTDKTAVYAHDGLGTDVLRKTESASYQIVDSGVSDKILLFSRTHPNSTRWYNESNIVMSWRGPSASQYKYILSDTILKEMPANSFITNKKEIVIPAPEDGVSYFHLQPLGESEEIYYFKINSDQSVPSIPSVRLSNEVVKVGDLIRMEFEAQDQTSGIEEPYYYVSFNGNTFFPVISPFYTSLPSVGEHAIVIRAFDNAGNYSDHKTIVEASSAFANPALLILSQFSAGL